MVQPQSRPGMPYRKLLHGHPRYKLKEPAFSWFCYLNHLHNSAVSSVCAPCAAGTYFVGGAITRCRHMCGTLTRLILASPQALPFVLPALPAPIPLKVRFRRDCHYSLRKYLNPLSRIFAGSSVCTPCTTRTYSDRG